MFRPDRLPDARGAGIPDRVGLNLPVLLAAWLGEVVRIDLRSDHDHRGAGRREQVGDIGMEWGVTSFMPGGEPTIDPYLGREVDRPEMQQEPLAGGEPDQVKRTSIPA